MAPHSTTAICEPFIQMVKLFRLACIVQVSELASIAKRSLGNSVSRPPLRDRKATAVTGRYEAWTTEAPDLGDRLFASTLAYPGAYR